MERDAFLTVVGRAVARSSLPEPPPLDPGLLVPDLPPVDLVERFGAALTAVDGEVHRDVDPLAVIAGVARAEEATEYIAWDQEDLPVPGVIDLLSEMGLTRADHRVPAEADARLEHQMRYRPIVLGITGADAGFAESGSLVLRSGPGRPRMASVVPLVHVALLEERHIHRSLAHWAADHATGMAGVSNVVFVTGPSRTGDIEQQLNLGVHGPRRVHVVLVRDR